MAVQPGIPAGLEFRRPRQFQFRRQLPALRNRRKLLRLYQCAHSDRFISRQQFDDASTSYQGASTTNSWCLRQPHEYTSGGGEALRCGYIDPNPIGSLDNQGHNYFLSRDPYVLNSYASFGELYYNVTNDFKLTSGGRWTEDQKHLSTSRARCSRRDTAIPFSA